MRWFVKGDLDGFFGLALDNLVQLLVITTLCSSPFVLGLPDELVYGRILPGAAVSLLVGNLFYAWQAQRLARATGRTDVCALPYGINTVAIFGHVFLVMLPAKLLAQAGGATPEAAAHLAWQVGLVACLGSGLIELIGAPFAGWIRKVSPRAALLSTLAGIALGFIAFSFLFRTFATPVVGLVTLGIVLLTYFGKVRFRGGLPGGLVAITLGTLLAWVTGVAHGGAAPTADLGLHLPVPVLGELLSALGSGWTYLAVIVPMGIFNVIGSLQNLESAEAAGDRFATGPSLTANGLGSVAAACFGSCFPTTIYIGHPGWKALGARAGYSILNAGFCTIICLTGTMALVSWAVPIEAGMAIVVWIGIVITAQAFQATPAAHAPAVVLGLLPGIGAWGALMLKQGLRAGSDLAHATQPVFLNPELSATLARQDVAVAGVFALEQGFIFTAMILSATTVLVIERRFRIAAIWCAVAAVLSATGFMHSWTLTPGDTAGNLGQPAWPWAIGWASVAGILVLAPWLTRPADEPPVG